MINKKNFKIGKIIIGTNRPPIILPEIGINHNGSLKNAKRLVKSAAVAGAKIIKHQTHIPEDEMSFHAKKVIPGNSKDNIYNIIKKSSLSEDEEIELKNFTEDLGLEYLSTPFSFKSVDRLVKMNVKAFKIGSGECNNFEFVKYVASFKKPIIMSTGMNTFKSIEPSVRVLKNSKVPFILLHCTSVYPAPNKLLNLGVIKSLGKKFRCLTGYSDHSKGNQVAKTAIAIGSVLIEKHYVHTKRTKGPDVICSMDHADLKSLIKDSHSIFETLGNSKKVLKEEQKTINFAFSSIVAKNTIQKNETLSRDNLAFKRPANGEFKCFDIKKLLGKKAKKRIIRDHQIKKNYIKK